LKLPLKSLIAALAKCHDLLHVAVRFVVRFMAQESRAPA